MTRLTTLLLFAGVALTACHPGPVLSPKLAANGTVAGIVSTEANAPVAGRKVTAVNVSTGARFDATTGPDGGYTIKLPEGTYKLEIELRSGEVVVKQPDQTKINSSDLDPGRNFTIGVKLP
jgi:hypothetical protein